MTKKLLGLFCFIFISALATAQPAFNTRCDTNIVLNDLNVTTKVAAKSIHPTDFYSIDSAFDLMKVLYGLIGGATGLQGTLNASNTANNVGSNVSDIWLQDASAGSGYNTHISAGALSLENNGTPLAVLQASVRGGTNSFLRLVDNASNLNVRIAAGSPLTQDWLFTTPIDTGGVIAVENGKDRITVSNLGTQGVVDYNAVGIYTPGPWAKAALFDASGVGELGLEDATNPHHYNQLYAYQGLTGIANGNYLPSSNHNGDTLATIGDITKAVSNVPLDSVLKAGFISTRSIQLNLFPDTLTVSPGEILDKDNAGRETYITPVAFNTNKLVSSTNIGIGIDYHTIQAGMDNAVDLTGVNTVLSFPDTTGVPVGTFVTYADSFPKESGTVALTKDIPSLTPVTSHGVVGATTNQTILSFTAPASNSYYEIGGFVNVKAVSGIVNFGVNYYDETNTFQTQAIASSLTVTTGSGALNMTNTGNFNFAHNGFWVKGGTPVVVVVTIPSGTATYDAIAVALKY